jgi:hypothetical protein
MSWGGYPKIYAIGHAAVKELLLEPVTVEEKVDGSQFSFWKSETGELHARSKGAMLNMEAPDKMFARGVEVVKSLANVLTQGYMYSGEYLAKPKHNTLVYDRVPTNNIAIFDIRTGPECYLSRADKAAEAAKLGLEVVPLIYDGPIGDAAMVRSFLDRPSFLGGCKVEGVVVKNYQRFTKDGKAMLAKFVSEEFKEVHGGDWRERNPTNGDIFQRIIEEYKTPARWMKAVQHLREEGKLTDSPADIGHLIKEVTNDVLVECEEEIATKLFNYVWDKQLRRGITAGLPEWYKNELMKASFK